MARYTSIYTGAQIDQKITGCFGGIHAHENTTSQSIANGATYIKVINFMDNEVSQNLTSDATNSKITILRAGKYRIEGTISFASGTGNITAFGSVFADGLESENIHFTRKIGTAGDVGSAALSGLLDLDVGAELDFRVRHDSGVPVNLTFSYMNINISRIDI